VERSTRRPPRILPPPRVPVVSDTSQSPEARPPRGGSSRIQKTVLATVFIALALGLIGVFVLLPRWADHNEELLAATGIAAQPENTAAAPPPAAPSAPAASSIADRLPTVTPRPPPTPPPPTPRQRAGGARVDTPSPVLDDFMQAMSEALVALEREQWAAARGAFERASRIRTGSPEVADGLARARAGLRRESIENGLRRATRLEAAEAWHDAVNAYSEILELEPAAALAQKGRDRAAIRADLDDQFEFHLRNPGRLSSLAVLESAGSLVVEAREITPRGPRLENQITRLGQLVTTASEPVLVVFESDNLTEVIVFRVGRLGTFNQRKLSLRPGLYTVVGSRQGFRDVRLHLKVVPGTPAAPLMIRCTEAL